MTEIDWHNETVLRIYSIIRDSGLKYIRAEQATEEIPRIIKDCPDLTKVFKSEVQANG